MVQQEPEYMANWAVTVSEQLSKELEIVIVGSEYQEVAAHFQSQYQPNRVILASASESELPLISYKTAMSDKTTIYVCSEKVCRRPVTSIQEAEQEIEKLLSFN